MSARVTSTFRQFVTTLVVVCLSVCCCQAQMLAHGDSDTQGGGPVEAAAASSCCSGQCASEADPESDEPAVPMRGCKTCCIKGSGLQTGPRLDIPETVVALPPVPEFVEVCVAPEMPVIAPEAAPPYVAPPTLWRLRCAMIV